MHTKVNHYNVGVLLGQHIPQTRQVLRKLISDRIIDGKELHGGPSARRSMMRMGKGVHLHGAGEPQPVIGRWYRD